MKEKNRIIMSNEYFQVSINKDTGYVEKLEITEDYHRMNWIEGMEPWGKIAMKTWKCELDYNTFNIKKIQTQTVNNKPNNPVEKIACLYSNELMDVSVIRYFTDKGNYREEYEIINKRPGVLFLGKGDIGLSIPFSDDYPNAKICKTNRCHAHIWCGGSSSYIEALRMGGEGKNIGIMFTDGNFCEYSQFSNNKNGDRGDFVIHPSQMELDQGESYKITVEMFLFEKREEFHNKLMKYKNYVKFDFPYFSCNQNEKLKGIVSPISTDTVMKLNGEPITYQYENYKGILDLDTSKSGSYTLEVCKGEDIAVAVFFIAPKFENLLMNRKQFIVEKQQYKKSSTLRGSFVVYDNELEEQIISRINDKNAARERIGMGVLMALSERVYGAKPYYVDAIKKYKSFVESNILDVESGEVYNDIAYNNDDFRFYNYPWLSDFYLQCYFLFEDKECLNIAVKIIENYYKNGGKTFYAFGFQVIELLDTLKKINDMKTYNRILYLFEEQACQMIKVGSDFPAHEHNFEQSIIAPVIIMMTQLYLTSGKKLYIDEARKQIKYLELFHGRQPHFRLHNLPIRHWDAFWFGKKQVKGDTFPHYWSVLTSEAYRYFYLATNETAYLKKAKEILACNLSLFDTEGKGFCAYIYPLMVDGRSVKGNDPWANDQDWALVYFLRHINMEIGKKYQIKKEK